MNTNSKLKSRVTLLIFLLLTLCFSLVLTGVIGVTENVAYAETYEDGITAEPAGENFTFYREQYGTLKDTPQTLPTLPATFAVNFGTQASFTKAYALIYTTSENVYPGEKLTVYWWDSQKADYDPVNSKLFLNLYNDDGTFSQCVAFQYTGWNTSEVTIPNDAKGQKIAIVGMSSSVAKGINSHIESPGGRVNICILPLKARTYPTEGYTIENLNGHQFAYKGNNQSAVDFNPTTDHYDIEGRMTATDVGTYTTTFIPKRQYCWSDGTFGPKTITFSVINAAGYPRHPSEAELNFAGFKIGVKDYTINAANGIGQNILLNGSEQWLPGSYAQNKFNMLRKSTGEALVMLTTNTGDPVAGFYSTDSGNPSKTNLTLDVAAKTVVSVGTPQSLDDLWVDEDGRIYYLYKDHRHTGGIRYYLSGSGFTQNENNASRAFTRIAAPTAITGLYTNGTAQTGVPAGTGYSITGNTATAAGSYTATVTLKEGYKFTGSEEASVTVKWSITESTVMKPMDQTSTTLDVVLDTISKDTFWDGEEYDQSVYMKDADYGGTVKASSPGTYTFTVTPKYGKRWATDKGQGLYDTRTYTWTIKARTAIEIPTAETGLFTNGTTQTGVPAGTGYTITGNTATDAGNYTATVKLQDGYKFTGSDAKELTINWSIAQSSVMMIYENSSSTMDWLIDGLPNMESWEGKEYDWSIFMKDADYSGAIKASSPGTYTFTVTPKYGKRWETDKGYGLYDTRTCTWTIKARTSPTVQGNTLENAAEIFAGGKYYFDAGKTHSPFAALADYVTFTGTPSAHGTQGVFSTQTFSVTMTPKDGYAWSDGTFGAKTYQWQIMPDRNPTAGELNTLGYKFDTALTIATGGSKDSKGIFYNGKWTWFTGAFIENQQSGHFPNFINGLVSQTSGNGAFIWTTPYGTTGTTFYSPKIGEFTSYMSYSYSNTSRINIYDTSASKKYNITIGTPQDLSDLYITDDGYVYYIYTDHNNYGSGTGNKTLGKIYYLGANGFVESKAQATQIVKTINKPTANTGLTYNGQPQYGVPLGAGYELSGDYCMTEAGTYTATVTLQPGYKFLEGGDTTFTITYTIAKDSGQHFEIEGDSALEALGTTEWKILNGYADSGYVWTSSNPLVATVDGNGVITAHRAGTTTITLYHPGDGKNYGEYSIEKEITVTLTDGFYIGDLSAPEKHTVYATLQEAIDAAKDGETVLIKGNPTVDATATVSKNITIKGADGNATLTRADGFNGSVIDVARGGVLRLEQLTIDGKNAEGSSLIDVNGALSLEGGATVKNGKAENGGAIYVNADASFTMNGGTLVGNTATANGGAIYIADGAGEIALNGGVIENNHANGFGNGIYTHDTSIAYDGSDATERLTDGLIIGGNAVIEVTNALTHKISVTFENPEAQISSDNSFVTTTIASINGDTLKQYFRVSNPGYTFKADTDSLKLAVSSDLVATMIVGTDGSGKPIYHDCYSIEEAIAYAAENNIDTIYFIRNTNVATEIDDKIIEIANTIVIPAGANLKFDTIQRYVGSDGGEFVYQTSDTPVTLKRQGNLTAEMVRVEKDATLTIGNVILDGGAVYKDGKLVVTDDGKGGAGTASTGNTGITAHAPVIVNQGSLTLASGAKITNNDNNYAKPGFGFGSQNYGGGVRNEGAGNFTMKDGASITNCYSREGGAIINIDKAASGGNPTVTIEGGTIENNASQMKGAAIQTIYGGAVTEIKDGTIGGNVSLHDLGSLSVEEGGTLTIGGGTVSAGGDNTNAVYLYNKYAAEDYSNASTKPFIEGNGVGKLNIKGSAALTGNVHIDGSCYVVNPDTGKPSSNFYEPILDLTGYTGNNITLDIAAGKNYGAVAIADSKAALEKIKMTLPSPTEYGTRSVYIAGNADGTFEYRYSGFELTVTQNKPGELLIEGTGGADVTDIIVTIGGTEYKLTVTDGKISETIPLPSAVDFAASLTVKRGDDILSTKTLPNLKVLQLDPTTGEITAPDNTQYVSKDDGKKPLTNGTLPDDLKVDENGDAEIYIGDELRVIHVGKRVQKPETSDPSIAGGLLDITDTSVTIKGADGYEYNLIDASGKLVGTWKGVKKNEDGTIDTNIVFDNLTAGTAYNIVVRASATSELLPSESLTIRENVSTLTTAEKTTKDEFESAFNEIKEKIENGTASTEEITQVIEKYNALPDAVKDLPEIGEAKKALDEGFIVAEVKEWRTEYNEILGKEPVTEEDETAIVAALDAFDKLKESSKALLEEDRARLIEKIKSIASIRIEKALSEAVQNGGNQTAIDELAKQYKDLIGDVSVDTKAAIDVLTEKAVAAFKVRTEYDQILSASAEKMTKESLTALGGILNDQLTGLESTESEIAALKDAAVLALRKEEVKGIVEYRFEEIVNDAEKNGITADGLKEIEAVKTAQVKAVTDAADLSGVTDLKTSTILALDKAEGKASLTGYLNTDDANDIIALVTDRDTGANAQIDTAADKAAIDTIVKDTKLVIEKERAKDAVEAAARMFNTTAGAAIKDEYTGESGAIAEAADKDAAWLEAKRAIAKIELESARSETLAKIKTGDPNADAKKAAVDNVIDEAMTAIGAITDQTAISEKVETTKIAAVKALTDFDRNQFFNAHKTILEKNIDGIAADDLTAIDVALDDLAKNYISESQDALNDLRDDLLTKKKVALKAAIEAQKDGTSVDSVANGYLAKLDAVSISGGTEEDKAANTQLDTLKKFAEDAIALEKYKNEKIAALKNSKKDGDSAELTAAIDAGIKAISGIAFDETKALSEQKTAVDTKLTEIDAAILLQRQKDQAKAAFDEAYQAIVKNGEPDAAKINEAHTAIQNAETLKAINTALGEKLNAAADSLLEGDSETSANIVKDVTTKITEAVTTANTQDTVVTLPDEIGGLADALNAQREKEKTNAKAALAQKIAEEFGELSPEAEALIADAKQKIDNGTYIEYELITEKTLAKMTVLTKCEELIADAEDKNYAGTDKLTEAKDDAFAAIDKISEKDEIAGVKAEALFDLERKNAALEILNEVKSDDSDFVQKVAAETEKLLNEVTLAEGTDKLNEIVTKAKTQINAERFQDDFAALRKNFDDIAAGDQAVIEQAREAYKEMPADVKAALNQAAKEEGYSSYDSKLEDAIAKAEFETVKEEVVEQVKQQVHAHDGERVQDILNKEVERIETEFNYEQEKDDSKRAEKLETKKNEVIGTSDESKTEVKHAQKQQRVENQLKNDGEIKFDSGRYNDSQKEQIESIIEEAKAAIDEIGSDATDELDRLLEETKAKLDEVPVIGVSTGELKPDKRPIEGEGEADYPDGHDSNEVWGIVTNDSGMESSLQLVIEKKNTEAMRKIENALKNGKLQIAEGSKLDENGITALVDGKEIKSTLDIYLKKGDVKITEFEGKYVVKILLTDEMRDMVGLQVVYVADDGSVEVYQTEIEDGKYLVFTTAHFSEFFILGEKEVNLLWLIVLLSVLLAGELIALLVLLFKKKKNGGDGSNASKEKPVKTYSFLPLLGAIMIPASGVTVCIVLGVCVVTAGAAIAVVAVKRKKTEKPSYEADKEGELTSPQITEEYEPTESITETEVGVNPAPVHYEKTDVSEPQKDMENSTEEIAAAVSSDCACEDSVSAGDEETESARVYDARTKRFVTVDYNRSYSAKLIQSDETVKKYYSELKNEILSYRGVKSRKSWKAETFRFGRDPFVKMQIRGKTLTLCFPLSSTAYSGTKYHTEDVSQFATNADTPCLYRIKNNLRCKYAKDLIADAAKSLALIKGENADVDYVSEIPYQSTEELIAQKLVKLLPKAEPQKEKFTPQKEVKATEVSSLLKNEVAAALIEESGKVSDKTKKTYINADTLKEYFDSGETVTLEEMKKRIPRFDSKATYVKVLARGSLDKPLTVEADAFSLDAVKMIVLTGGKVIRIGGKDV